MYQDGDYQIFLNNNLLIVLVLMVMLPTDVVVDGQVKLSIG